MRLEDHPAVKSLDPREVSRPESAEALAAELTRAAHSRLSVLPSGQGSRSGAGGPIADGRTPRLAPGMDGLGPRECAEDQTERREDARNRTATSEASRQGNDCGEGSNAPPGDTRLDLLLLTTELARLVHYEPADLTVTVEAGCDLRELDRILGEKGQCLPLQGRRRGGTVGGLLATAPEGAVALGYGHPRDWLTGMRAALADGSLIKGGGRVVKNVAGYPVHRLMIGSSGTLGVIVEASFKVSPRPEREGTALAVFASAQAAFAAARLVLDSGMEPVLVNVLLEGGETHLCVGFDGSELRVSAHLKRLGDVVAPARPVGLRVLTEEEQRGLRDRLDDPWASGQSFPLTERPSGGTAHGTGAEADFPSSESAPEMVRAKAVLPLSEPASAMAPDSARGAGPLPRELTPRVVMRAIALPSRIEELTARVCEAAAEGGARTVADARPGLGSLYLALEGPDASTSARGLGEALAASREIGHAVVISAPPEVRASVDPWGAPPPDFSLMKRIKHALDPDGVLVAGRFVGGL